MENIIDPHAWLLVYAVGVKLFSIWWPLIVAVGILTIICLFAKRSNPFK